MTTLKLKDVEPDDTVCGSFLIKGDEKIVNLIADMSEEHRRYIFNMIQQDSATDTLCELFEAKKNTEGKLSANILEEGYNGFIYKFKDRGYEEDSLLFVFSDMRVALMHFLKDHSEEYHLNKELTEKSIVSFTSPEDLTWFKDRSLNEVNDFLVALIKKFTK